MQENTQKETETHKSIHHISLNNIFTWIQVILALCEFRYCEFHYCDFSKHSRNIWLLPFSSKFISLLQFFKTFHKYLPYANFGLFISFRTNEINSQKFPQGKYLWNVLKNSSNEIRTNEIRIRREPSIGRNNCL